MKLPTWGFTPFLAAKNCEYLFVFQSAIAEAGKSPSQGKSFFTTGIEFLEQRNNQIND